MSASPVNEFYKKQTYRFVAFVGLIYLGMGISKTAHPLWFAANGHLPLFGFASAVMAFVGAFSFLITPLGHRIGQKTLIRVGCLLYAAAMALRVFTHSYWIVGISALLGGLGAGTLILSIRLAIVRAEAQTARISFLAGKNAAVNISLALGALIAGVMIDGLGSARHGYVITLLFACAFPLLALFFIPSQAPGQEAPSSDEASRSIKKAISQNAFLAILLMLLSFICGTYTSLITPYLPVIFAGIFGEKISYVGLLLAGCTALGSCVPLLVNRFVKSMASSALFIFSQSAFLMTTLLIGFVFDPLYLAFIALFRAILGAMAFLSHELIEMDFLKEGTAIHFLGLMQSSFLVGDILGSGIGGYFYATQGMTVVIVGATLLIALEGIILMGARLSRRFN